VKHLLNVRRVLDTSIGLKTNGGVKLVNVHLNLQTATFFADLYSVHNKQKRLEKIVKWAEKNEMAFSWLVNAYVALPTNYKNYFKFLLEDHTPQKAMRIIQRMQKIVASAEEKGYKFKLKSGIVCTIKRLDKTNLLQPRYEAEYSKRSRELLASRTYKKQLKRILKQFGIQNYVFQFKIERVRFGIITKVIRDSNSGENCLCPNLLNIIDDMKKGTIHEMYTCYFINQQICLPFSNGARAVATAIKERIVPALAPLIN